MQKQTKDNDTLSIILWVLTLGMLTFFSNLHRGTMSVLGSEIAGEFNLDSIALGALGSAIFYAYGLMQIPAGILADRVSSRKLLAISSFLTAVSTLWFGVTHSYTGLVCARIMTGAATAVAYVPALTAIRRRFGDKHYGLLTGILSTFSNLGGLCASAPTHFLSNAFGWRNAILFYGLLSLLLTAATWLIITETKDQKKLSPFSLSGLVLDVKSLLSIGLICVAIGFFCVGGSRQAFSGLWGGNYFTEALQLGSDTSSLYLMIVSAGCCIGTMVFGSLADRFGSFRMLLIGSILVAVNWFAFAFSQNAPTPVIILLSLVLGIAGSGSYIMGYSCISLFADTSKTGLYTGIMNGCGFVGTAVFTQAGGGILALSSGSVNDQFCLLFSVFGILSLISTVLIFFFNRDKLTA